MRDPHVEAVYYIAGSDREEIEYRDPAPVEWRAELANYWLEDGQLTAKPHGHYSSAQEAREALRVELDAWEAHVDLSRGRGELRFKYRDANVVDRDPPMNGAALQFECFEGVATGESFSVHVGRGEYPSPPSFPRVDTDIVRDLVARFRQWQDGGEPFASMAYAVLTRMEARAGGHRSDAAGYYLISNRILDRLGKGVSTGKGDPLGVRKFEQDGTERMEKEEEDWLRKAVPAVIQQVAAVEAGQNPEQLTMADLP